MALSQEFWLQQRRREAAGGSGCGGCGGGGVVVPPSAASGSAGGPVGAAAGSIPGAACSAGPLAGSPVGNGSGCPMGGPVGASTGSVTASSASGGGAAAPAGGAPGVAALGLLPALQNGLLQPPQMGMPPMQAMSFPPGTNMMPGMQWANVAPQQRALVDPVFAREHKAWNSDDEDIDEFGRKKRKSRKAETPVPAADTLAAAVSSAARSRRCADERECPAADAEVTEPPRKSAKTKGLSAKQQAALERLHGRSKQKIEEKRAAEESNGAGHTASASSTAAAGTSSVEPAGLAGLAQIQPLVSGMEATAPFAASAATGDPHAAAAMAAAMAAAGWPQALMPSHAGMQLPCAGEFSAAAAGAAALTGAVPAAVAGVAAPMGQQPRLVLPPAWRPPAAAAGAPTPQALERQLMDATAAGAAWPRQDDDKGWFAEQAVDHLIDSAAWAAAAAVSTSGDEVGGVHGPATNGDQATAGEAPWLAVAGHILDGNASKVGH